MMQRGSVPVGAILGSLPPDKMSQPQQTDTDLWLIA